MNICTIWVKLGDKSITSAQRIHLAPILLYIYNIRCFPCRMWAPQRRQHVAGGDIIRSEIHHIYYSLLYITHTRRARGSSDDTCVAHNTRLAAVAVWRWRRLSADVFMWLYVARSRCNKFDKLFDTMSAASVREAERLAAPAASGTLRITQLTFNAKRIAQAPARRRRQCGRQ